MKKYGIFLLSFFFLSCSDLENEGTLETKVFPTIPIVINAEYKVKLPGGGGDGEELVVDPPWFFVTMNFQNPLTDRTINVVSIVFEAENIFTGEKGETAPDDPNEDDDVFFRLGPSQSLLYRFYIGSLPAPPENDEEPFFLYNVEVKLIGWYSDPTDPDHTPIARYKQSLYFFTE